MVKNPPANLGDVGSIPLMGKILWKRKWQLTPVFLGFPGGSDGRESACKAGSLGWEDPLEKGPSVFWPGEFHEQRNLAEYSPWGRKRVGHS